MINAKAVTVSYRPLFLIYLIITHNVCDAMCYNFFYRGSPFMSLLSIKVSILSTTNQLRLKRTSNPSQQFMRFVSLFWQKGGHIKWKNKLYWKLILLQGFFHQVSLLLHRGAQVLRQRSRGENNEWQFYKLSIIW